MISLRKKMVMRLAGLGLIGTAALAGLPGYWAIAAGLAGVVLFLLAGPA